MAPINPVVAIATREGDEDIGRLDAHAGADTLTAKVRGDHCLRIAVTDWSANGAALASRSFGQLTH